MQLPTSVSFLGSAFTVPSLFFFAALLLSSFLIKKLAKEHRHEASALHFQGFAIWVLVSRISYVLINFDTYQVNPIQILNIKDGGWEMSIGFIALFIFALYKTRKPSPLRKTALLTFLFTLVLAIVAWLYDITSKAQNTPIPDQPLTAVTTIKDITGKQAGLEEHLDKVNLRDFKAKPVVINFWASWCGPCRAEMHLLAKAQQDNPDIHFIFINVDEDEETILNYFDDNNLVLNNVLQDTPDGKMAKQLSVAAIPTTIFFDRYGAWNNYIINTLSQAELEKALKALRKK